MTTWYPVPHAMPRRSIRGGADESERGPVVGMVIALRPSDLVLRLAQGLGRRAAGDERLIEALHEQRRGLRVDLPVAGECHTRPGHEKRPRRTDRARARAQPSACCVARRQNDERTVQAKPDDL